MALLHYLLLLLLVAFSSAAAAVIGVDPSGNGDHRSIQDAIDSVPVNNSGHVIILVKPGVYQEKIIVPWNKPFITLSGTKRSKQAIITWDGHGDIFSSPTVTVFAPDFVARYLTIQNTHGAGAKAVALRVAGDRASFYRCRFLSHQDTLLDDTGRHYFRSCYIRGDTDFICGNAASVFEKCHLHSISQGNGAITAQQRESPEQKTGFIFVGCKITGSSSTVLGRPWGPYSRVVFALTYMSSVIKPQGWDDHWGNSSRQMTAYYGEYKCWGPGAWSSGRASWSHRLTLEEAEPYLSWGAIGGKGWIRSSVKRLNKAWMLEQLS